MFQWKVSTFYSIFRFLNFKAVDNILIHNRIVFLSERNNCAFNNNKIKLENTSLYPFEIFFMT